MAVQEPKYYVYVYAHPLSGVILYVGKGSDKRFEHHLRRAKYGRKYHSNEYLQKEIKALLREDLEPIILRVAFFEKEQDALSYEVTLIAKYRLLNQAKCNLNDGGDGFTSELSKEYSNRPEVKERVRQQSKERWANPEYKKEVTQKISIANTNNPKIIANYKLKWADQSYRDKMCEMSKANWQNKDYRAKLIEKQRLFMSDPEYKNKMGGIIKAKWADPKYRAMMIEARKRGRVNVSQI